VVSSVGRYPHFCPAPPRPIWTVLRTIDFCFWVYLSEYFSLIQVYNFYPELQEKLNWDGMTAVSISCVLGIAIALRELKRLF